MTKQNKLIVGGVLVALVAYYLYDRNKKMKALADLKAGADVEAVELPVGVKSIKSVIEKPLKYQELNREVL